MKAFNKVIGSEIVVDTGIIVEYIIGSDLGKKIEENIFLNDFIISILATPLLAIEIYYLLCRKRSSKFAMESIKKMESILSLIPLNEYIINCGEIKAKHPFALSDCCTLGLAHFKKINALFLHEKEIDQQLQKVKSDEYTQQIVFIEDFEVFNDKM